MEFAATRARSVRRTLGWFKLETWNRFVRALDILDVGAYEWDRD